MKPLPRTFYARDTEAVAKELLGKCLVRRTCEGDIVAKIVEVEAYGGTDDPASHAYRGKTSRNWLMFGNAGFAYVYFIYGNHFCLNATTEREGTPGAVLIRAVEIIDGLELALKRRKTNRLPNLSNGPGKLTKALGITKTQNGLDLTKPGELYICHPRNPESLDIVTTPRVGIKVASERLWRFYIKDNEFISRH